MEVYINDILSKSLKLEDHVKDIRETFNVLKKLKK